MTQTLTSNHGHSHYWLTIGSLLCDSRFEESNSFIENARTQRDARVLVHCRMGQSRSATLVVAYIMSHYKCSPEQEKKALNMIENDDGSGEGALSGGKRLTGGVRAFVLGAVVAVMMTSNFF